MKLNEKGSSLIQVLLVILVFTVLGLALMGSVLGENKRTHATESNMQARYLAESGLTYFEQDYKNFIDEESRNHEPINFYKFNEYLSLNFLANYKNGMNVKPTTADSKNEQITVSACIVGPNGVCMSDTEVITSDPNDLRIQVTSNGIIRDSNNNIKSHSKLIGYYKPEISIDKYTAEIADFEEDGKAIDFSEVKAVGVDLNTTKLLGVTKPLFDVLNAVLGLLGLDHLQLTVTAELLQQDLLEAGLLLNLGDVINADVINLPGNEDKFYRVPSDNVVGVNALGPVLNLEIPDLSNKETRNTFETMEKHRVIATGEGEIANLEVLKDEKGTLLNANVLDLKTENNLNVKIDGYNNFFQALGIPLINSYFDIEFKKLAVMGNVVIQQDRYGAVQDIDRSISNIKLTDLIFPWNWENLNPYGVRRRFTFDEGLFVNKSLIIGGKYSKTGNNLMLRGDMVAMKDLHISDVNLQFGDTDKNQAVLSNDERNSDFYIHNNAMIKQSACINPKDKTKYGMRIFSKGTITIENNPSCSTYEGLFYARKGINIKTNGKPITINGALLGDVKIDGVPLDEYKHKGTLFKYNVNPNYPFLYHVYLNKTELTNLGRTMDKSN
ncbi:PilX N-terminal domain-containing pilus assembly protein [Bacillus marasmi]|uniref:PilX N-terminal domain-containing pilus assembly protein n=1 Tax=Bacillus marasmi TaxID=1926279 RepID=UPI0011CBAA91|nr:PilX N-terminal domain-containing pilus assembly protein [Bacillus marasmi]